MRRLPKIPSPPSLESFPESVRAEIAELREAESRNQASAARAQRLVRDLFLTYGREIVVQSLPISPWKYLDPVKGWRHGREGTLPPREFLDHPGPVSICVTTESAEALLRRDGF